MYTASAPSPFVLVLACVGLLLPLSQGCTSDNSGTSSGENDSADTCVPIGETEYTQEEIDYFTDITGGTEFENNTEELRKWTQDVGIKVIGSPTEADLETVNSLTNELDTLISPIDIRLVDNAPSIEIYFVPQKEFENYELKDMEYQPGNKGFFWVLWRDCELYRARVLISTTGISQRERDHLIREELTQSFGFMHDSKKCEDSIFQQEWTKVTEYAPIDKQLIKTLYRPELKPCMTDQEVARTLKQLEK